jgi:hypothetical protein
MCNLLTDRLDSLVEDGIEATVKFKHRRRLERLGWGHAFSPTSPGVFAPGDPPRARGAGSRYSSMAPTPCPCSLRPWPRPSPSYT